MSVTQVSFSFFFNSILKSPANIMGWYYDQGFFSRKRGARTHKRGKDKHTESFVSISLYNITVYIVTS
jgi:hypothetical protein